ncbi:iron (metal) dependent repressor, DtxR family [Nakamurella panacisegetis]|uniref:Manganese transport regulator n=1 Tax=Nakamurella panacisegetis TaxID=1090615 RepID=A0A1H0KZU9_9ACTN|nr:metal-dependent transcriptional regulator [Nakamurella panacisegetis]SDO61498.1 iron (metal) dependent repressor, DtxR family [Nakamurella panacisegetis]
MPDPPVAASRWSDSVENYLKVIYTHTEWQPAPATVSALAAKLQLAPSSVAEMIKKLDRMGLVEHVRYGAVTLTGRGRLAALDMVRKHRLLESYLVAELGYSWDEVHDEAEVLEHVISPLLLDRIDARLGRPTRDPHGDPIPRSDGTVDRPVATVLADLAAGTTGSVVRISDADPAVLNLAAQAGLGLDSLVTVVRLEPLIVSVAGARVQLPAGAATAIWVARFDPATMPR